MTSGPNEGGVSGTGSGGRSAGITRLIPAQALGWGRPLVSPSSGVTATPRVLAPCPSCVSLLPPTIVRTAVTGSRAHAIQRDLMPSLPAFHLHRPSFQRRPLSGVNTRVWGLLFNPLQRARGCVWKELSGSGWLLSRACRPRLTMNTGLQAPPPPQTLRRMEGRHQA